MDNFTAVFFIFGAKYAIILSFIVGGVYFFQSSREEQKRFALFAAIALPLMYITAKIGGHLYDNPRPFVVGHFTPLIAHDPDNGFPSDHTLLASGIAAAVFLFRRRIGLILWVIALVVAVSRVLVGVHHPIDVIGSMVIALTVSLGAFFTLNHTKRKKFDNSLKERTMKNPQ